MNTRGRNGDAEKPACSGAFVRANLKAYLDRELSPVRRWYVAVHVSRCAACREEIAWFQRLGNNVRQLEDAHPRPELRARILATLPAMDPVTVQPTIVFPRARSNRMRIAAGMACCLMLAAGAVFGITRLRAAGANANRMVTNSGGPRSMHEHHIAPDAPKRGAAPVIQDPNDTPDPVSDEANRMYAEQVKAEKDLAARQLPESWKKAVAVAKAGAEQTHSSETKPYVQVVLEVGSITSAEKQISKWANASKAAVKLIPAAESGLHTASVEMTVSPAVSSSLLASLRQTGTVSSVTSAVASTVAGPGTAGPSPLKYKSADSPNEQNPGKHGTAVVAGPVGSQPTPASTKPITKVAAKTIIVMIELAETG